jgi:cytochrome bd-type quinol oxidase subunit 2
MTTLAVTTVDLARAQFATTSLYHFLFVPLTLGLTPLVAIMQTAWYRTGVDAWLHLTEFFGALLLINFARRNVDRGVAGPLVPAVVGAAAVVLCAALVRAGRVGWAFAATGVAAIATVATLCTGLHPRVLVSDPTFANSLTVTGAATERYALTVITVVGAVLLPIVLLYQGWTYHVLRARLAGGG